jgi:hypothetical protein
MTKNTQNPPLGKPAEVTTTRTLWGLTGDKAT